VSWEEYSESKSLLILDQRNALKDVLSVKEKQDARAAFDSIDSDGNGCLSQSEVRTFFTKRAEIDILNGLRKRQAAMVQVEKQVSMLFMFKDADGSGTVDFEEFLQEEAKNIVADRFREDKEALIAVPADVNVAAGDLDGASAPLALNEDQVEHARMKFADWDKDGNGTLEVKELQGIFKEMNVPGCSPVKLSNKEFRALMKKAFKKVDADDDGHLSFEEFLGVYNFIYLQQLDFDSL